MHDGQTELQKYFSFVPPKLGIHFYISISLFLLALAVRLFMFGYPNQYVFDEVHFINFASHYNDNTYYYDQHPPLGKLLIYEFGKIASWDGAPSQNKIGDNFPNNGYIYLRLLPILLGSLIPPTVYLLARKLRMSTIVSIFASVLIVFENSLVNESRFVLMDSGLILFGFLGLYLYLTSIHARQMNWFKCLAGFSLAFSFGIKWTGLSFLGLVVLVEIYRSVTNKYKFKDILLSVLFFMIIPILIYVSTFYIHFKLLDKVGNGEWAMSQEFNAGKLSFTDKFIELNSKMFHTQSGLRKGHAYSSKWYTWPFMQRGVFVWHDTTAKNVFIYILGNPIIYWISLLGVMISIFIFKKRKDKIILFLLFGYFLNLIPFALIQRPMFLYHYLVSLIFAILCTGYAIDRIENRRTKLMVIGTITLVSFALFIYFSPIIYGLDGFDTLSRFWFHSWR